MLLFYTGRQRAAESVLTSENAAIEQGDRQTIDALSAMRDLAYELRDRLSEGDDEALGSLLDANWQLKRSLADGITNPTIDDLYARARDAGAAGGKLLGAGGSGFLLIVAPPERHGAIRRAVSADLREVPFRFSSRGTHVAMFEPREAI
jgi:D-glycero-alpha-D-manno-heptose-7-phosphate kinase